MVIKNIFNFKCCYKECYKWYDEFSLLYCILLFGFFNGLFEIKLG